MSGSEQGDRAREELLRVLLENKVISEAQAHLVKQDEEATGMTCEEILLARRWVTEKKLIELAPWLKQEHNSGDGVKFSSYEENLKRYRKLLAEILGESSEKQ